MKVSQSFTFLNFNFKININKLSSNLTKQHILINSNNKIRTDKNILTKHKFILYTKY